MRGFSLLVWCVVTAMMFYSAWRFKSQDIENDIIARVTEGVTEAGGGNVAVEVDGRHVNLRGFAPTATRKAELLDTADTTYGALGPIDGLMLPNAPTRTFLSAARMDDGVILSGVVGTVAEREMLVTQAKAAGLGNVTDDLTVADGQIGWTENAQAGFSQLADLNSGHLYVSDDRNTLSGNAPTVEVATAASALGEGWNSFVAGPALDDPRIPTLEGEIASRDTKLTDLNAMITDRDTTIINLNNKLSGVTTDLTTSQTQFAGLETELGQKNAHINLLKRDAQAKTLALAGAAQAADAQAGRITSLETELANTATETTSMQGEMADMTSQLALLRQNGGEKSANLEAALAEKTAEVTELESELVALNTSKDQTINDLNTQISDLSGKNAEANTAISDLSARMTDANATIEDLSAQKAAADTTISDLSGKNAEAETAISDLSARMTDANAKIEDLSALKATADTTISDLTAQKSEADTIIANLSAQKTEAETTIAELSAKIDEVDTTLTTANQSIATDRAANEAEVAALQTELGNAQNKQTETDNARLTALTINDELKAQLTAQTAQTDDLSTKLAEQTTKTAAISQEVDTLKSRLSEFDLTQAKVGQLETVVSERDVKIAALMADLAKKPVQNEVQTVAQCNSTATGLLAEGKINFVTNSADILDTSEPLLERITGVVLACSGPEADASVTVAGHTDNRGSDNANQVLSEARAQSVANFMIDRGVDPKALQPIGFGEAQPIATNETSQGRAENRRISFEFQAR